MAAPAVPAEVRAGAEFLDKTVGGEWFEKINLDTLDIDSGCSCVAAQIVGGFEGGYDNAWEYAMFEWGIVHFEGLPEEIQGIDMDRAKALGFLAEAVGSSVELEEGWKDLIAARVLARGDS